MNDQLTAQKNTLSKAFIEARAAVKKLAPSSRLTPNEISQLYNSIQAIVSIADLAINNQAPFAETNFRFGDFMEAFEDSSIGKLIWIPGSLGEGVLTDYLGELGREDWQRLFPLVYAREDFSAIYFSRFHEDRLEALCLAKYLGFIAEIHVPIKRNILLDENLNPKAWSSGIGRRIYPVHAYTIIDLVDLVKQANKESILIDIEKQQLKELKNG